jgi:hypothetical protein
MHALITFHFFYSSNCVIMAPVLSLLQGNTWYSNWTGDFTKAMQLEHARGGDPNLPPPTEWVYCAR